MSRASDRTKAAREGDLSRQFRATSKVIGEEIAELEREIVLLRNGNAVMRRIDTALVAREAALRAALGQLVDQVEQMKGLFPDEDGALARALADAETALNGTGGAQ